MWRMAPDQLERYRKAVAADKTGESLTELLSALRAVGIQAGGHDALKTAPKGYPKDHPRIELLALQGCHQLGAVAAGSLARQGWRQGASCQVLPDLTAAQ